MGIWRRLTDWSESSDGTLAGPAMRTGAIATERTWQDVTDSRSLNTTYTNSTGSEITVAVSVKASADGTRVGLNWDGSSFSSSVGRFDRTIDSGDWATVNATVADGDDYQVTGFGDTGGYSVVAWNEFRP